jgi:hypothetical protein
MQVAHIVHAVASVLMMAMFLGHIYMGTIGIKGAYQAMRPAMSTSPGPRSTTSSGTTTSRPARSPRSARAASAAPAGDPLATPSRVAAPDSDEGGNSVMKAFACRCPRLPAGSALAKLPPPSDEAKAKAAEAAAKGAGTERSPTTSSASRMDGGRRLLREGQAGRQGRQAAGCHAACADPGPFVYTPPAAARCAPVTAAAASGAGRGRPKK